MHFKQFKGGKIRVQRMVTTACWFMKVNEPRGDVIIVILKLERCIYIIVVCGLDIKFKKFYLSFQNKAL